LSSHKQTGSRADKRGSSILYSHLVDKIQRCEISEREFETYFERDESKSEPFKPALRLNEEHVDVTGVELAARASATMLGMDAARIVRDGQGRIGQARVESGASAITILAEGDSWFNLPILFPKTLIDILGRSIPVVNIAHWGDELAQMIDAGEYLPHLARGDITHFLFSGAGNDILGGGQLHRFLRLFDIDHRTPDDAGYYPTPAFYDALDRVETLFRQLSRTVLKISPRTKLVLHGYDYAIPTVDGPFLGRSMERQGLDPVAKGDLCRAIIRFMVETFNRRLDRLSRELSNVTYVNFVGTLSPNDWFDELHAREAGAVKLARKLADQLGWRLEAQALHEADATERAEPRDVEVVEIRIANGDAPEDAASARRMGLLGDNETPEAEEVAPSSVGEQEELRSEADANDEAFGVPFPELDAFERLSETAPNAEVTAHEADRQGRGPARRRTEAAGGPEILFGSNAKAADVTELSRRVLQDIMRRAGLSRVTISSTSRSPADQARVMFDNLERFGVNHQKALYGPSGDLVIEVYRRAKNAGLAAAVIKERMRNEIVRIGPTRVSRHAADPRVLNVFDVAPSSVQNRSAFEQAVRQDARVSRFITPPTDPGYHLEIPQTG
jgi:hypothetical protein